MEVILVRHSVTQGNKEKRFVGRLDVPLAPEGERRMRTREEERGGDFASPALSKSIITLLYSMSRIIFEKNNGPWEAII